MPRPSRTDSARVHVADEETEALLTGAGAWAGVSSYIFPKGNSKDARGRMSIKTVNLGNFYQPTTELLSEGLATAVLEAGHPGSAGQGRQGEEGGPAGHPWMQGPGTLCLTEGKQSPGSAAKASAGLSPGLAVVGRVWPLVFSNIKWKRFHLRGCGEAWLAREEAPQAKWHPHLAPR